MPYLQNATHEGFIFNEATKAEFLGNGTHAAMAMRYFVANLPTGQLDANNQPIYANYNIGQAVGLYSSNGTGANLTEIYLNPVKLAITATETELSNVTVWSANSILTQGRADARYQNAANNTYANLTGTPNLSLYLTTANAATTYLPSANFSFSNLTGKPTTLSGYGITDGLTSATAAATYLPSANFTYANISGTIPTATNTTLGAIKVGSNLTIANGVLSATSSGGFQNGDTLNGGTY